MNAKRYFAKTARDALKRVKEELGPDAVILANRAVDGGTEILAAPAEALLGMSAPAAAPVQAPAPSRTPVRDALPDTTEDFEVSLSQSVSRRAAGTRAAAAEFKPFRPRTATADETRGAVRGIGSEAARDEASREPPRHTASAPQRTRESEPAPRAAPSVPPRNAQAAEAAGAMPREVMEELASLRALVEQQLCGFAWAQVSRDTPARSQLAAELLEAGFSAELTRHLVDGVVGSDTLATARNELKTLISRQLMTLNADNDIVDRGGVYALVGPTGVGKTTTTAKLAARCVVRHGAGSVALITTDSYRIGAHEQLRIYGRILGVPVHVVRDTADLTRSLIELSERHMVLIDTVGMSQRDRMVAEQAAMLSAGGRVARLLLLNATARADTLDDVVRAYRGPDLAGAIMTKVDEATGLGTVLDVLLRHELPLYYVANGQRVPEDLHLPNRPYLLHRSLKKADETSAHHLDEQEAGLRLAASGQRLATTGEGQRG